MLFPNIHLDKQNKWMSTWGRKPKTSLKMKKSDDVICFPLKARKLANIIWTSMVYFGPKCFQSDFKGGPRLKKGFCQSKNSQMSLNCRWSANFDLRRPIWKKISYIYDKRTLSLYHSVHPLSSHIVVSRPHFAFKMWNQDFINSFIS